MHGACAVRERCAARWRLWRDLAGAAGHAHRRCDAASYEDRICKTTPCSITTGYFKSRLSLLELTASLVSDINSGDQAPSASEACFEASNCLRADRTPAHLAMSGTPSAGGGRTGGEEAHRVQTMSATCGDHASSRDQETSSYILIFLTQAQAEGRCRHCCVTAHPCQMRCASTI